MDYESKLKSELPSGSFPRDTSDPDQIEMGIWGRKFDALEVGNKELLEGTGSPALATAWLIEGYERQYALHPLPSDSLGTRQSAVIAAMGRVRNISTATIQRVASGFWGYFPEILTAPTGFYLGQSAFNSGRKLVEDHIKFGFWVELNAAITPKPYDDILLIAALKLAAPADVQNVWTYWSDEAFDWSIYTP